MQERCYNSFEGTRGYNKNIKIQKRRGGGAVNIWTLKEKISALKYGRDIDIEAANTFAEYIKSYHQDHIISKRGLIFDKTIH